MKLSYAIATLAACTMLSGTALADGPKHKNKHNRGQATSTSVSGGAAAAGPQGAVAGGVGAAQGTRSYTPRERRGTAQVMPPSSVSTSTSGAVYTDRNRGSAAINTNGAATGSGSLRSSSEGDVYSSTTRQGSDAEAYGNSEAEADEPNRK